MENRDRFALKLVEHIIFPIILKKKAFSQETHIVLSKSEFL